MATPAAAPKTVIPTPVSQPVALASVEPVAALERPTTPAPDVALATISGCLESEDGVYWLKDTSGDDAPTSRSWKWGMMKKRTVPIVLVDANKTLNLSRHVGERVTAAGILDDREMRARTLKTLARCD